MNTQILIDIASQLVADHKGLLAMDESNPTCNKRFAKLNIPQTVDARRAYRELIVTAPGLGESICADWKILKKPKFWLEFGYDAMSRMTKIPAKDFFLEYPEVLEVIEKLRRKSKENAARHNNAYRKS